MQRFGYSKAAARMHELSDRVQKFYKDRQREREEREKAEIIRATTAPAATIEAPARPLGAPNHMTF